jgi:hypothetical protein
MYLQKYKLFRRFVREGADFGKQDVSGNIYGEGTANIVPLAKLTAVAEDNKVFLDSEITRLNNDISKTEDEINKVNDSIKNTNTKINENNNILNERLTSILNLNDQIQKAKAAEEAAEKELSSRLQNVNSIMETSAQKSQSGTAAQNILPKLNFNNPSNLAACYSVRQVVPSYTGPVVRLRRSSDGNLQDFYSNGKQQFQVNYRSTKWTTAARGLGDKFVDWLGSSTAYVVIWYDQSPNGNHAINNNHDESQPIITSQSGHWVIQFQSGNNTFLNIPKKISANTIFTECGTPDKNKLLGIVGMSTSSNGDDFMNQMQQANITTYINNSQRASTRINTFVNSIISPIPPNTLNTCSIISDTATPAYIDTIGMNMNFTWFDGYVADIIIHNKQMNGQDATDYFDNRLLIETPSSG